MMFAAGASSTFAQVDETFQFMDKDGNIIADGTELVCKEVEDLGFGPQISTGLFVKSNATDDKVFAKVQCVIEEIPDNSSIQCCFPANCMMFNQGVGTYNNGPAAYGSSDFQTEWFPATDDNYEYVEGQCKASFQLFACTKKTFGSGFNEAAGPTVKVQFIYKKHTGIDGVWAEQLNSKCYDLQGRELQAIPERGIYIQNGKKYVK